MRHISRRSGSGCQPGRGRGVYCSDACWWGTVQVTRGDMFMRPIRKDVSMARVGFIVGTLALAGCVPSAYVYDYPQAGYYSSGYGYYSTVQPGYYAQPGNYYYAQPGYFGQTGSPPTVVYYEQDRDGDSHDRDHDRHDGGNDVDRHDRDGHDGRNDHYSQDGRSGRPVPHGRNPCAGSACGPSGDASGPPATRDQTESRGSKRSDRDSRTGKRVALD